MKMRMNKRYLICLIMRVNISRFTKKKKKKNSPKFNNFLKNKNSKAFQGSPSLRYNLSEFYKSEYGERYKFDKSSFFSICFFFFSFC